MDEQRKLSAETLLLKAIANTNKDKSKKMYSEVKKIKIGKKTTESIVCGVELTKKTN